MRRLAIALLAAAGALLAGDALGATPAYAQDDDAAALAPVDVLQVSGLIDPIQVESINDAIDRAGENGAQALVLQINSKGAVISRDEMAALLTRVAEADVPVGVWVGPSGARLYGLPAQLLAVADVTGMAPGARVGHSGVPLSVDGVPVDLGPAEAELRSGSMGLSDARAAGVFKQRISDEGIPTVTSMILALDGFEGPNGALHTIVEVVDDTGNVQREAGTVRFSKLGLVDQLFHTVASPAVTYLLLLIGLSLLVFEFFTAGVGIAGVVGAACVVLAATGLAVLPTRWWAIGLILAAMVAFAVDVQVGIPRFWTGVGVVLTIIASFALFESMPGSSLRPPWLSLIAGIGGTMLTFIVGMPSMVRTRFATPTIGREWMIGSLGTAEGTVDPDGVITVGEARWRARTNRATPIPAGEPVRVVAIDGVTLEVEPLEGAARDHRERRRSTESDASGEGPVSGT